MPTKFKVWGDESSNLMTYADFAADTQRKNGFQTGTAASSTRVNTILKQNSLLSTALMSIVDPTGIIDFTSTLDTLSTKLSEFLGIFVTNITYNTDQRKLIVTLKNTGTFSVDISGLLDGTCDKALKDGEGRNIVSTYATKTELNQMKPLVLYKHEIAPSSGSYTNYTLSIIDNISTDETLETLCDYNITNMVSSYIVRNAGGGYNKEIYKVERIKKYDNNSFQVYFYEYNSPQSITNIIFDMNHIREMHKEWKTNQN